MQPHPISTAYEPSAIESSWYRRWIEKNCFHADETSHAPAYSLLLPPPNITGSLTLGHVLNATIQDVLARRARQRGEEVLWLPGTDHAGIATQTVVERELFKLEKKTRDQLGRRAFLERVWQWKSKHGEIIIEQLQRLGCSCDWGRARFTMDESYVRRVQEVFIDLYQKGLLYRGKRMVHWCPVSRTALSDEEVVMKKQQRPLYFFKLEVVEEPGVWLSIATTRPETIMGDAALAVHPQDPRYARYIGKHVRRPLPVESEVLLPILGDDVVDMTFGTGVLKVTPAHDPLDYQIGVRHQLPIIEIINPDGKLNALAGASFLGMDRFEARLKVIETLRALGLFLKEEIHENQVGFSERANVPIEPRLSQQWFLRYPKTSQARDAVREKLLRFFPERWEKVYDHWLQNIEDWCISRQLWWGHQIPAWYRTSENEVLPQEEIKVQVHSPGPGWVQDPDVLDTWFSSWLWADETMDKATRRKFYPTQVLVTGPDIIFFWVARMIMASLEYCQELPFNDVYFTGMIRDQQGRKMSKSLGNSPNPLDLIDKYGADGLRIGMIRMTPHGQDIRFDEKQIEEGRHFANKIWNAARFRQLQGAISSELQLHCYDELPDIAIMLLVRFEELIVKIEEAYREYRFQEMVFLLDRFFRSEYCDWFVEAAKPLFNSGTPQRRAALLAVMDHVFSGFLRLLHPFMPHLTEELWMRLQYQAPASQPGRPAFLIYTELPRASALHHLHQETVVASTQRVEALYAAIHAARNLRATLKIPAKQAINFLIFSEEENFVWNEEQIAIFSSLLKAKHLEILKELPSQEYPSVLTSLGIIMISLEGLFDVQAERQRLGTEIKKVENELVKVRSKLANPIFVEKVPPSVLQEHQQREKSWQERLQSLQAMLAKLP